VGIGGRIKMKKSWTFLGLGILIVAFIGFLFRLITLPIFQGRQLWLIVFGALGIVLIILSFILKKSKKFLLWFGLGSLMYGILSFVLRILGMNNNVTLLIVSIILGLVLLIIGLIKRG
jgi:hypothetical protein